MSYSVPATYNGWASYAGQPFEVKTDDNTTVLTGTIDASGCGTLSLPLPDNYIGGLHWFVDGVKRRVGSFDYRLVPDNAGIGGLAAAVDAMPEAVANVEIGDSENPIQPEGTLGNATAKLNLVPHSAAVLPTPAPENSSLCKPYGYFKRPNQTPWAGLKVTFYLLSPEPTSGGRVIADRTVTVTADSNGEIGTSATESDNIKLDRNDAIDPPGTTWRIVCKEASIDAEVTLNSGLFDLGSLVRTS